MPQHPAKEITYKPIGIIHSPYKQPKGTPIQPTAAKGAKGTVEVYPEYAEGLNGLENFSHIILIYHFHLAKPGPLKVKPYMDNKPHGVFATRAPSRPNPIGISVVKLTKIEGNTLHVENIDIIDGTPLLDIKPHIPQFDTPPTAKIGWLTKNIHKLPQTTDNGRFQKI